MRQAKAIQAVLTALLTISFVYLALTTTSPYLAAATPQPPVPNTGTLAVQLHDTDVSEPPLVAPCGSAAATLSRQRWILPGEGAYTARAIVTGSGTLGFSAGGHSTSVPTPCNPCVLTVPAGPVGTYMQYSLTLGPGACPADTLILTAWTVSAGP